jgi:hypothetical protein
MWHPALDTVVLARPHRAAMPRFYGELFRRQFPAEARWAQALALPIASLKEHRRERAELAGCWEGYPQLRRIVVVLEEAIHGHHGGDAVFFPGTCELVAGMKKRLGGMAEGREGLRQVVPLVVLVRAELDILRAEAREMRLVCGPWLPSDGHACKATPVHSG